MNKNNWKDHFQEHLDGSDAERVELYKTLSEESEQSPKAIDQFVNMREIDFLLSSEFSPSAADDLFVSGVCGALEKQRMPPKEFVLSVVKRDEERRSTAKQARKRHRLMWAAAAAVAGIAIILTTLEFNAGQAERYVATVERLSKDAQLSLPVVLGSKIGTGPIEIHSGTLNLRFDSGALVTLHGPARFIPMDERGGTLVHGILIGRAPADHSGLRIIGPNFEVTDLGTEFALRVDKTRGSELLVIEGSVALKPQGGELVTVEQNGAYHIDSSDRVSALSEERIRDAFGQTLITRREPLSILTPDTVAFLSFAGGRPETWRDLAADSPVPFTVPADPATGAAILDGSGIINLGFRTDLMFDSPKSFEARIYINHLGKMEKLFSIHTRDHSRFRQNRGGWGVGINEDPDGTIHPFFVNFSGDKHRFSAARLPVGRWFHFLITLDNTQVRLYVDGELQGESMGVARMITPQEEYSAMIGNMQKRHNFTGKISYIAIHRRVLSPQEIQSRLKPGDQP